MQSRFSRLRVTHDVWPIRAFCAFCLLLMFSVPACTSTRYTTHTQKSGTEQLLVSRALERALEQPPAQLKGARAFIEVSTLLPDLNYFVVKGLEHWLLKGGATPIDDRTTADCIISVLVKAIGTDGSDYSFGIPSLPIPLANLTSPPVTVFGGSILKGYVEMEIVIHPFGGGLKAEMGPLIGKSHYKRYVVLFVPITFQNIYSK